MSTILFIELLTVRASRLHHIFQILRRCKLMKWICDNLYCNLFIFITKLTLHFSICTNYYSQQWITNLPKSLSKTLSKSGYVCRKNFKFNYRCMPCRKGTFAGGVKEYEGECLNCSAGKWCIQTHYEGWSFSKDFNRTQLFHGHFDKSYDFMIWSTSRELSTVIVYY